MNVSIELVPRSEAYLVEQLEVIQDKLPMVNMINIPDLKRLPMRSWEGCRIAQPYFNANIPHIRAVDVKRGGDLPAWSAAIKHQFDSVLVVTGDYAEDVDKGTVEDSVSLIRRLKRVYPHLKVYGALDPYRKSFTDEIAYAHEKLAAGADGFFTQPFFDVRMMGIYAELLKGIDIFWGVAPVLSERSVGYWQKMNRAVFPADFDPSLQWNRRFAREALEFVVERDDSIYFMPIKADVETYLGGIL